MYSFGKKSAANLATTHKLMQRVARRALELTPYDFAIVHGWRGKDIQNALHASGASETPWPGSKHNHTKNGEPCSLAVDFAPWVGNSIPWNETHVFAVIAGCFFAAAAELGIDLRWGGDWDGDGNTQEHKLQDWGHIELVI